MCDYNNLPTAPSRSFGQNQPALVTTSSSFCPTLSTASSMGLMTKLPNKAMSSNQLTAPKLFAASISPNSAAIPASISSMSNIFSGGYHSLTALPKTLPLDRSLSTQNNLHTSLGTVSCGDFSLKDPAFIATAPMAHNYRHAQLTSSMGSELSRVPDNTHTKPNLSYRSLISQAIFCSEHGKLTLASIYKSIAERHPYYRMDEHGWQNSIRHNLTLGECFIRVPREPGEGGKGSYWIIHENFYREIQADGTMKRSRTKGPVSSGRSRKRSSKVSSTPSTPLLSSSSSASSSVSSSSAMLLKNAGCIDNKTKKRRVISAPEFTTSSRANTMNTIGNSAKRLRPTTMLNKRQSIMMTTAGPPSLPTSMSNNNAISTSTTLNTTMGTSFPFMSPSKMNYPAFSLIAPFGTNVSSTNTGLNGLNPTAMMATMKYDNYTSANLADSTKLQQQLNSYTNWLPSFPTSANNSSNNPNISSILSSTTSPPIAPLLTSVSSGSLNNISATAFSNSSMNSGHYNSLHNMNESNSSWSNVFSPSNLSHTTRETNPYSARAMANTNESSDKLMFPTWHDYSMGNVHTTTTTTTNSTNTATTASILDSITHKYHNNATDSLMAELTTTTATTAHTITSSNSNSDSMDSDSLSDLVKFEDMIDMNQVDMTTTTTATTTKSSSPISVKQHSDEDDHSVISSPIEKFSDYLTDSKSTTHLSPMLSPLALDDTLNQTSPGLAITTTNNNTISNSSNNSSSTSLSFNPSGHDDNIQLLEEIRVLMETNDYANMMVRAEQRAQHTTSRTTFTLPLNTLSENNSRHTSPMTIMTNDEQETTDTLGITTTPSNTSNHINSSSSNSSIHSHEDTDNIMLTSTSSSVSSSPLLNSSSSSTPPFTSN